MTYTPGRRTPLQERIANDSRNRSAKAINEDRRMAKSHALQDSLWGDPGMRNPITDYGVDNGYLDSTTPRLGRRGDSSYSNEGWRHYWLWRWIFEAGEFVMRLFVRW